MTYEYRPSGVCSRRFLFEIENNVIQSLSVEGGCNGNLQGIGALVKGMEVKDVVARLKGIACGMKSTSCPDQIATALEKYLQSEQ